VLPDGIHIFKPKKNKFGKVLEGLAMEDFGILRAILSIIYAKMVYFMAIWYILCSFGIFFPVLVCCAEKNLATLLPRYVLKSTPS
jgi:hypothetical protein